MALCAVCVMGWLVLVPTAPAGAAEPGGVEPTEIQDARDAYRLGVSLIKQGQWSDALAAFERSLRLKPDAVTAFNIGYCERALGRLTRARQSFAHALAAPELPPDKAAEARGYLAEIESRLSRAVITLSPAGASLAVDGRPFEVAAGADLIAGTREPGPPEAVGATSFTVVLDPGPHVILVRAPGLPDAVVTRDLAPGATATLTLAPGAAPPSPTPVPEPLVDKAAAARSARRTGALIAFGAGGAAALVGTVFGALALHDKSALGGACPQMNQCASSARGTIDAMYTFATVSTVGLALAVAGAGAGTIVLLADRPAAPLTATRLSGLGLSIGPAYAGLRGAF